MYKLRVNLSKEKRQDVRFMAQDFGFFGVEFKNLTVEKLDEIMEQKISRLQEWLKNAKYTDAFLSEFVSDNPDKDSSEDYYQLTSNFSTILHEYRAIRNYLITGINCSNEENNENHFNIKNHYMLFKECNYSINPERFEKEFKLQLWFEELSNPILQFYLKKEYEYATNDLYYFEFSEKYSGPGRLWFDLVRRNYNQMKKELLSYNVPLTLKDLEYLYELTLEENAVKTKDTGNEILNVLLIQIARIKKMSELDSLKKFIDLIKEGKVKPANNKYTDRIKQYIRDRVVEDQTIFDINRKIAIDYLESIKPKNLNENAYKKNNLFDERNDNAFDKQYYDGLSDSMLYRKEILDKIDEKIDNEFIRYNRFLSHINIYNDSNFQGVGEDERKIIINRLLNEFVEIDEIDNVNKIREIIAKVGLTFTMFKYIEQPDKSLIIKPKTITEIQSDKEKIFEYIISLDEEMDYVTILNLIDKIYSRYEISKSCYDYIVEYSKKLQNSQNMNVEPFGYRR